MHLLFYLVSMSDICIRISQELYGMHQLMPETLSDSHLQLADLMIHITKDHLAKESSTLVVLESCEYCIEDDVHGRLLQYFLMNFQGQMALQLITEPIGDQPWNFNMIIVDGLWAFQSLHWRILRSKQAQTFSFLIILTANNSLFHRLRIMRSIFTICMHSGVSDVIILTAAEANGSFNFYTYDTFDVYDFNEVQHIRKINAFRNGNLENDFLFTYPPKSDLNQRPIRVCARIEHPLLSFFGDQKNLSHINDMERLVGIEGDILKLLATILNFRIQLTFPEKSGIDENFCLKELERKHAVIAMGGYGNFPENMFRATASLSYYQTPLVFIVRSDVNFGPLKQLACPFTQWLWYCIFLTLLITMFFIRKIRHFLGEKASSELESNTFKPIFNVLAIFFGNPTTFLPKTNFIRLIFIAWLLAAFVLRSAYQGKVFDSLRTSMRMPVPRSLSELIERKYMLLSSTYKDYYPRNMTMLISNVTLRYGIVANTEDGGITTISLLDTLGIYNRFHLEQSRLTYVNKPILQFQTVMYFQKHSNLKKLFDHKLQQLINGGITAHIADRHNFKDYQNLNIGNQRLPKINNEMLTGLYYMWAVLLKLAFVMFIFELLAKKSQRIRKAVNRLEIGIK